MVLLVVFLATSQLIFASLGTAQAGSNKEVAESVATGFLSQERQAASNEGASWFTSSGLPTSSTSSPGWCNTPCTPIVQIIASTSYYVYVTGGWCAESTTGSWGNLAGTGPFGSSTNPYAGYFVAIKVAWGHGAYETTSTGVSGIDSENQIMMQGLITTSGGDVSSAPSAGPVDSCPVGSLR